jgi:hypothetical protein
MVGLSVVGLVVVGGATDGVPVEGAPVAGLAEVGAGADEVAVGPTVVGVDAGGAVAGATVGVGAAELGPTVGGGVDCIVGTAEVGDGVQSGSPLRPILLLPNMRRPRRLLSALLQSALDPLLLEPPCGLRDPLDPLLELLLLCR